MLTKQFYGLLKGDLSHPFSLIDDGNSNTSIGKNTNGDIAYTTLISDTQSRIVYNKKWMERFSMYPSMNTSTPSVDDYTIEHYDLEECAGLTVYYTYSNGALTIQISGTFENTSSIDKTYTKCGVFTNTHYWDNGEQNNEVMVIESLFEEPLTLGAGESASINITESFEV